MEFYVTILQLLDIFGSIRFPPKKQKQLELQTAICSPCLKFCLGKDQTTKSCCFPKCIPQHSAGPQETPEGAQKCLFFSPSPGNQMCGSGQHPSL